RSTADDHTIDGDAAARLDDNTVADPDLAREDAYFLTVAQHPAADGTDGDKVADGSLGALERDALQALADHADEDKASRFERGADEDGGNDGDGQGQVSADASFEQAFNGAVESADSANDGSDEAEGDGHLAEAELVGPGRPADVVEPEMGGEQQGDEA